jgi:hypothetical protein
MCETKIQQGFIAIMEQEENMVVTKKTYPTSQGKK